MIMRSVRLSCVLLTVCLLYPTAEGKPRFRPDRLYAGFYASGYMHDRVEKRGGMKYEQGVRKLLNLVQRNGFNCLYLAIRHDELDNGRFPFWLAECAKRDIRIVCQLDFAYLRNNSNVDELVAKAVGFLKRFGAHPAVLAISVREEPPASLLGKLQAYYTGILKAAPDTVLQLTHAKTNAAAVTPEPYPHLMGGDPYPFHWTPWAQGYTATPRYAFTWFRKNCHAFWESAYARKALYQLTFTSNAYWRSCDEAELKKRYGKKPALLKQIRKWAKDGNQSWFIEPKTGLYARWELHRPPTNATRAMVWIGVMEGAKSLLHWSLSPSYPPEPAGKRAPERTKFFTMGGVDLAGDGPELAEYAETFRTLRRFEDLILNMRKDTTSLIGAPELMLRMHQLDTGQWLAVVVNTHIGSWNKGDTRYFKNDDVYRFSKRGRPLDFQPDEAPRSYRIKVPTSLGVPYDLHTGKPLWRASGKHEATYALRLMPGRGRFLFIGRRSDLPRVLRRCKKPASPARAK